MPPPTSVLQILWHSWHRSSISRTRPRGCVVASRLGAVQFVARASPSVVACAPPPSSAVSLSRFPCRYPRTRTSRFRCGSRCSSARTGRGRRSCARRHRSRKLWRSSAIAPVVVTMRLRDIPVSYPRRRPCHGNGLDGADRLRGRLAAPPVDPACRSSFSAVLLIPLAAVWQLVSGKPTALFALLAPLVGAFLVANYYAFDVYDGPPYYRNSEAGDMPALAVYLGSFRGACDRLTDLVPPAIRGGADRARVPRLRRARLLLARLPLRPAPQSVLNCSNGWRQALQ